MLYSPDSACIQPLKALMEGQTRRALVLWALEGALPLLEIFEKTCGEDPRPRELLGIAEAWSRGQVKMPLAKQAILACHRAATEAADCPAAQAAARAMGHAAATIHVKTHALGLVLYGLTAFVYDEKPKDKEAFIAPILAGWTERLLYWQGQADAADRPWATFLLKDG